MLASKLSVDQIRKSKQRKARYNRPLERKGKNKPRPFHQRKNPRKPKPRKSQKLLSLKTRNQKKMFRKEKTRSRREQRNPSSKKTRPVVRPQVLNSQPLRHRPKALTCRTVVTRKKQRNRQYISTIGTRGATQMTKKRREFALLAKV